MRLRRRDRRGSPPRGSHLALDSEKAPFSLHSTHLYEERAILDI